MKHQCVLLISALLVGLTACGGGSSGSKENPNPAVPNNSAVAAKPSSTPVAPNTAADSAKPSSMPVDPNTVADSNKPVAPNTAADSANPSSTPVDPNAPAVTIRSVFPNEPIDTKQQDYDKALDQVKNNPESIKQYLEDPELALWLWRNLEASSSNVELNNDQKIIIDDLFSTALKKMVMPALTFTDKDGVQLQRQTDAMIRVDLPVEWQYALAIQQSVVQQKKSVLDLDKLFTFTLQDANQREITDKAGDKLHVRLIDVYDKRIDLTKMDYFALEFDVLDASIQQIKVTPNKSVFNFTEQVGDDLSFTWSVEVAKSIAADFDLERFKALFVQAPSKQQGKQAEIPTYSTATNNLSLSDDGVAFLRSKRLRIFYLKANASDPSALKRGREVIMDTITAESLKELAGELINEVDFSNDSLWMEIIRSQRGDRETQEKNAFSVVLTFY